METITNAKTYIITAAIAASIGIVGGTQLSTTPTTTPATVDVVTPDTTTQVTLSSEVVDDLGKTIYRIHEGPYSYDFNSYDQLEKFSNTTNEDDDETTKNVRLVVKSELQNQTAEEYFNSIKQ